MAMTHHIVPFSEAVFAEVMVWYQLRAEAKELVAPPPELPRHGLAYMVSDEGGTATLVGAVCLYPTDGPYLYVEHFTLHPDLSKPGKGWKRRMMLGLHAARTLAYNVIVVCAAMRKVPIVAVARPSIAAVLKGMGYRKDATGTWSVAPTVRVMPPPPPTEPPKTAGKKRRKR